MDAGNWQRPFEHRGLRMRRTRAIQGIAGRRCRHKLSLFPCTARAAQPPPTVRPGNRLGAQQQTARGSMGPGRRDVGSMASRSTAAENRDCGVLVDIDRDPGAWLLGLYIRSEQRAGEMQNSVTAPPRATQADSTRGKGGWPQRIRTGPARLFVIRLAARPVCLRSHSRWIRSGLKHLPARLDTRHRRRRSPPYP